jgi:hypothetical protein
LVVATGGAFCAIAAPAPMIEIAKVTTTFKAFIIASPDHPALLGDRFRENPGALNENLFVRGAE